MSYDASKNKYKRVSLVKGGGTRKVDLPVDFNRDDVIKYAIKLFFPEDECTSDVSYDLANFKQEPVSKLVDTLGAKHDFTIQKYCELCKTHQFNLYLLVKENPIVVEDEELRDDDSADLLIPVFDSPLEAGLTDCPPIENSNLQLLSESHSYHTSSMSSAGRNYGRNGITERHNPSSTCTSTAGTDGQETFLNWTLMGSSSDRLQLRKEQQDELEKSLKVDREKEALKRDAAERQESLESLRSARRSRVPREPKETSDEEKVKISVRHPSMGSVSRWFLRRERMLVVYDWCGSLSLEPEFFGLYTAVPKTFVSPCEQVTSVAGAVLYVEEQSAPVSLSNDELEVSLKGFGLPHPDPIFDGHETIEDDDVPSAWYDFTTSPLSLESESDEHCR